MMFVCIVEIARVAAGAGHNDARSIEFGVIVQAVVVDETRVHVQSVRHALEEDRRGRDFLVRCVEAFQVFQSN